MKNAVKRSLMLVKNRYLTALKRQYKNSERKRGLENE